MHKQGCLAFTYFQPNRVSADFAALHPAWLVGHALDWTNPEVQRYMSGAFAAMRGSIDGVMYDYCDNVWRDSAQRGGFYDGHATATDYYRTLFEITKRGWGPNLWLHERNLGAPDNDLTLGLVDLQRTSGDTNKITPQLISISGLRWYKNRVVINYDMDSKDLKDGWEMPGWIGSAEDGRRMLLTMSYVAASRLLLSDSFRDLTADELHDLSRLFPYPEAPHSAQPVDGGLGLSVEADYYVYDFWNDSFAGRVHGADALSQTLRPGEARVLSLHRVVDHPQFLSTNRHISQGEVDMTTYPTWDAADARLSGASNVVGGEAYRIVIALNGHKFKAAHANGAEASIVGQATNPNLAVLEISSPVNRNVEWTVAFRN
jgi:hypothetical protein